MDPQSPKDSKNEGGIVISEEALAAIAVTAVRGVEGVTALVPRSANVARLLRQKGSLRYVKFMRAGAELSLEIALRVRAGVNITALACQAQCAVKNAVQDMTGKTVARVNLKIAGADF